MRTATLVLIGSLLLGGQASAQMKPVQTHQGLWGGFGAGAGYNLTDLNDAGGLWGFAGYGRIGGTLSQQVMLAGESAIWVGSRDGVNHTSGNLSAIIMYYPSPKGGIFLRGGIGIAYVMTSIDQSTTVGGIYYQTSVSQTKGGFGATASVGYDVRLGRNIYLVPEFGYYLQAVGSQTSTTFGTTPGTNNLLTFSLGLVWH
jgi:hypothetical protein